MSKPNTSTSRRAGRACVAGAILLCALCACGGSEEPKQTGAAPAQPPASAAPAPEAAAAAIPEDQPGADATRRAHMNLQGLAHLADVDHKGLFIDFGTPARMKYTVGNWKTGWGKDANERGVTFTYVAGNTGRVYFPADGGEALTLRLRVKPIGTASMQLFMNGEMLPAVKMEKGGGFGEYDVPVPVTAVAKGENSLLMRFGDTIKLNGEDVSVAVDWVRVLPGAVAEGAGPAPAAADAGFAAPEYASLVQDVAVGETKRKALRVEAPTTLSWHLEVPPDASLTFKLALASGKGATASVRVRPEGGTVESPFTEAAEGTWQDAVVPLAKWAGQVVRLDLVAEGDGALAWASPTVLVPEVQLAPPQRAENVIVLLIDTLRADKLKAYRKSSRVAAPVLDRFAQEGAVFTASQSPENWTKPSVASVLTGLYPMTHCTKQSDSRLPDGVLSLGEVFKKEGFATATFLANGYVSDKFGFKQGWDHYVNYIRDAKDTRAANVFKEAGDWIEQRKSERFFVYIQTIDPHVPYDPPDEYLKQYDPDEYTGPVSPRKTADQLEKAKRNPPKVVFDDRDRRRLEALYDGEVTYHDVQMGAFVERLKALGLYDRTIFVVTSDHGEEFHDHGSYGHGHSVYQELVHVPFMVRWSGVVRGGTRLPEAVGTLDIAPTVVSAAGIEVPEVMEGVDRTEHLRGRVPAGPAAAFSDFLDDRRAIRAGRWKLILRGLNVTLFDLERDPGEKTELEIARHPVAMRYCRVLLGQFLGARDRGDWLNPDPKRSSPVFSAEATNIDAQTAGQLKALGYAN
jgi:arylsulfatase A-like enzyme